MFPDVFVLCFFTARVQGKVSPIYQGKLPQIARGAAIAHLPGEANANLPGEAIANFRGEVISNSGRLLPSLADVLSACVGYPECSPISSQSPGGYDGVLPAFLSHGNAVGAGRT